VQLKKFDEYFYRYQDVAYSLGTDEWDNPLPGYNLAVECYKYPVIKHTAKGTWIDLGFGKRFVLRTARRRFAAATQADAMVCFRARKQSQIRILRGKLKRAEQALELCDGIEDLF